MEIMFAHSMALMIRRLVMRSVCDWKELFPNKLKSLSSQSQEIGNVLCSQSLSLLLTVCNLLSQIAMQWVP